MPVMPVPRTPGPMPAPRSPRSRPDPNPLRFLLGMAGLASAAALTTAMLPSVAPRPEAAAAEPPAAAVTQPEPSVRHVTRYVTLAPGQTAPPESTVVVGPRPTPRVTVKVVTRTRQSGGKP